MRKEDSECRQAFQEAGLRRKDRVWSDWEDRRSRAARTLEVREGAHPQGGAGQGACGEGPLESLCIPRQLASPGSGQGVVRIK